MTQFYIKVGIYMFSFILSLFGLSALDFSRFIAKGKVAQAQILYFILACALAYLFGNFLMSVMYYFY